MHQSCPIKSLKHRGEIKDETEKGQDRTVFATFEALRKFTGPNKGARTVRTTG
jgi:hypothetical protein